MIHVHVAIKNSITKYIQASYSIADKSVAEREFRSLEKINDNYDKYIMTMDNLELVGRNGIKCLSINL